MSLERKNYPVQNDITVTLFICICEMFDSSLDRDIYP
jgi:hypothetical protein